MKQIKWFFLLLAVVAIAIVATTILRETSPLTPPLAEVKIGGAKLQVTQGSYCWSSFGKGECVDKVAPHEMELGIPQVVAPEETISIAYKEAPSEHGVNIWRGDYNYETLTNDYTLTAPLEPGIYIYHSFARWSGKGDSSSIFQIEVK